VRVPFRGLAQQLEERLQQVELYKDLPRGKKRPGWQMAFLAALKEAARDMGQVSSEDVSKAVRQHRNEKRQRPEVTVEAEPEEARA
jgi:transposase-like protein